MTVGLLKECLRGVTDAFWDANQASAGNLVRSAFGRLPKDDFFNSPTVPYSPSPIPRREWFMRYLVSAVLLLMILPGNATVCQANQSTSPAAAVAGEPFTSDSIQEDTRFTQTFQNLVHVAVTVRDAARRPVKGAQVIAYSEDWGVTCPVVDGPFAVADETGTASIVLFPGRWSFFAGCGREYASANRGEGLFLGVVNRTISIDTVLGLQPTGAVDVYLPGDANEVFAMEDRHIPLVAMPFCGASGDGALRLHTTEGCSMKLLMVAFPANRIGFVVTSPTVRSGQEVNLTESIPKLPTLQIHAYDHLGGPGSANIGIGVPSMDLTQGYQITFFSIDKAAVLYLSPETMSYYLQYCADGSFFSFLSNCLRVEHGRTYKESFGGPLSVGIRASNDVASQNGTCIWFHATDQFGHILKNYRLQGGRVPVMVVRLLDPSGEVVFSKDWRHEADVLQMRTDKPFGAAGETYDVAWDLGVFGNHKLSGKLICDETRYGWGEAHTDHMDMQYPLNYRDKATEAITRLETAFNHLSDFTGQRDRRKIKVYIPACPTSAGVAGGDSIWAWLDGFIAWSPEGSMHIWEPVLYHELGHLMEEYAAKARAPLTGWRNETMATVLGFEALRKVSGETTARYHKAVEWRWFGQLIYGKLSRSSEDFQNVAPRFVMHSYLPVQYGDDIHRRFFRNWVAIRSVLRDYTEDQAFVTAYSALAARNLAPVFRFVGYDVTTDDVNNGLQLLASSQFHEEK